MLSGLVRGSISTLEPSMAADEADGPPAAPSVDNPGTHQATRLHLTLEYS